MPCLLSQSGADLGGLDHEQRKDGGPWAVTLWWSLADFKSKNDRTRSEFQKNPHSCGMKPSSEGTSMTPAGAGPCPECLLVPRLTTYLTNTQIGWGGDYSVYLMTPKKLHLETIHKDKKSFQLMNNHRKF